MSRRSRVFRILLFAGGAMAGVAVLLFSAVSAYNRHAYKEWTRVRAAMEARGETFDFQEMLPPPVPDDENFAMTPLLRPLLDYEFDPETQTSTWRDPAGKERAESISLDMGTSDYPKSVDWQEGERTDLDEWAAYLRESGGDGEISTSAEVVLAALRKFDDGLNEIALAARRPVARFPVHYEEGWYVALPHLNVILNLIKIRSLRASAHLENGESAATLEDVLTNLRIQSLLGREITLINHLVVVDGFHRTMQPVWEALEARVWSEPQLMKLGEALQKLDFLSGYQLALRGEAAFSVVVYDYLRQDPNGFEWLLSQVTKGNGIPYLSLLPRGISYHNQAYQVEVILDDLVPAIDPERHRVKVEEIGRFEEEGAEKRTESLFLHRISALIALPVYSSVTVRTAQTAAWADLARVAVALERFRLAHDEYPAALTEVAPEFIAKVPPDVTTGNPLQYRRAGERYLLYSVGWNMADDGGEIGRRGNGSGLDRKTGDWVWPVADAVTPTKGSDGAVPSIEQGEQ